MEKGKEVKEKEYKVFSKRHIPSTATMLLLLCTTYKATANG